MVFYNGRMTYDDYMKQMEGFTASRFNAAAWADLIEKSGAKYAVLTTKHHDGIALWDTQYSDLNTVKKTRAARDIVKEYADAITAKGLRLGLYSLIDWSHPDYPSVYEGGKVPDDPGSSNPFSYPLDGVQDETKWQKFLEFNNHQLKELLTGFGKVDLLWFDGDWERSEKQWNLPEFKQYLKSMQPDLIINSRLQGHGDYKTPEQGLPITRPDGTWEFCTTINSSWGTSQRISITNHCLRSFACSATASPWVATCCSILAQERTEQLMRGRKPSCLDWASGLDRMQRRYTGQETEL